MSQASHAYQDIREAVRDLCAQFPAEYFRKVDEERGYPDAFVRALTEAGWLAALIPQEYGGSGLGLTEASVIKMCIRDRVSAVDAGGALSGAGRAGDLRDRRGDVADRACGVCVAGGGAGGGAQVVAAEVEVASAL